MVLPLFSPCLAGSPAKPGPKDKCPVCGMFVHKYPEWVAQVHFRDGTRLFFDGAKDLFKFLAGPDKYSPGRRIQDVEAIFVTDYYSLEPVEAKGAFYVVGSDVYGPMGRELIPFSMEEEARAFLKDHSGKTVLSYPQVTQEVLKGLD